MDNATTWNIINTYFQDNPKALVRHHIDSYNDFYKNGIFNIFREKNPTVLYSRLDPDTNEYTSQCKLYMGGKDGSKIYFGKPVIHDESNVHYMYPNEARLRNMNYSMTIHYDIDVEFIDQLQPGEMPTVIGAELVKQNKDGNITVDNYTEGDLEETKESLQKSVEKELSRQPDEETTDPDDKNTGGGPKPTKIKRKKKDEIRLEMNIKAAAKLREVSESSLKGNTQTRIHTLEKVFLGAAKTPNRNDPCSCDSGKKYKKCCG